MKIMKKMKKSALAAAVLLSLSMMGSAYAANKTMDLKDINADVEVVAGDTLTLIDTTDIGVLNYAITGAGKTIVACDIQAFNRINTALVLNAGVSLDIHTKDAVEINSGSNKAVDFGGNSNSSLTIESDKSIAFSNASGGHGLYMQGANLEVSLSAPTITANTGSGRIAVLTGGSGSVLNINQDKKSGGTNYLNGIVTLKGKSVINYLTNSSVNIDGASVKIECNTSPESAVCVSGSNKANIGQLNNHGTITLKATSGYGIRVEAGIANVDGDVIDINGSAGGLFTTKATGNVFNIGQNNVDGNVKIGSTGSHAINVWQGAVDYDINVDGRNIVIESTKAGKNGIHAYSGGVKNNKENVIIIGKNSKDSSIIVSGTDNSLYYQYGGKISTEFYGRNIVMNGTIKIVEGGTQGDAKLLFCAAPTGESNVSVNTYTTVGTYTDDKAGTINNAGTMTLDGNGGTMTFNSGAISGAGTTNIIGNVVMHVPSIANQVNVGVDETKTGNLTFDMIDGNGTGTLALTNTTNSLNVLEGSKVFLNVDMDLSNDSTSWDKMTIQKLDSKTTISLNKVNVLADATADYTEKSFQLITVAEGVNNLTIAGTKVATDNAIYTIADGGSGSIKVDANVIGAGEILAEAIADAEVSKLEITEDKQVTKDLGTLANPETPEGAKRELTIDGNGNEIDGNGKAGVTVDNGQILNLINLTMNGFSGNAITNEAGGTVNTEGDFYADKVANNGTMNTSGFAYIDELAMGDGATVKVDGQLYSDTVTAIGSNNTMGAAHTYALGEDNKVMGEKSVAVGFANEVNGKGSGAFGDPNVVYGDGSYAFGNDNKIGTAEKHADNSFAVGNNTTVSGSNSVALGNGSTVTEDNVVSVGKTGAERKIVNVKAGEVDTDAVNYGQLKTATNMGTTAGNYYAANDSVVTAIGKVDTQVKTNTTAIATLQNAVGGKDGGLVKDVTALQTTVGDSTKGLVKKVTDIQKYVKEGGLDANGKKITNVADGTVAENSKEAVNGGQLWKVEQEIESAIGADVTELENKVDSNVSALNNRIDHMGTRINKVGAGAAALAAMHPVYDEDSKLTFSAGLGAYRNEKAAAVGMFFRFSPRVMMNAGATVGNDNNMYNVGLNFALDKHVRGGLPSKAVMAKQLTAQSAEIADLKAQIAQLIAMIEELKNK